MTTIRGEKRKYFLCTGKKHKKTYTGVKQTIYVEDIEKMVDGYIANKLKSIKLSRIHHSEENAAQINIIKLKVKETEKKMSLLSDIVLSGSLNEEMIEVLNDKAKKLTEEKQKHLNDIDALLKSPSNIRESLNFSKKWHKANFSEQKAVCNVLIKTIIVSEDGNFEIIWNI